MRLARIAVCVAGTRLRRRGIARRGRCLLVATLIGLLGSCADRADPRPDLLLVVIDTLRADAVSAYGAVEGTTPHLDALADGGLRYTRVFAPSPWTLPSHASIFTGLRVDQHGVGIGGRMGLPDPLVTLAEQLAAAGYQTAGFSENPLVSGLFGLDQGFENFAALSMDEVMNAAQRGAGARFDLISELASFTAARDADRPLFLFANLFDAHAPYEDRELDRFVPAGARVDQSWTPRLLRRASHMLCDRIPSAGDLAILRGLYLGDVAAADAKLGQIVRLAREAAGDRRLVVVVTSDHGEQLGEHRLLDHEFSVRAPVLHVPLVVHGLAGVAPARIEAPVELADIAPSLLDWSGIDLPDGLAGRALPTGAGAEPAVKDLFATYSDEKLRVPSDWEGDSVDSNTNAQKRAGCGPEDRVFGRMAALIRWPFKLIWFERYPAELYDLRWDPSERSDLAALRPEVAARLLESTARFVAAAGLTGSGPDEAGEAPATSAEALEALRGLGYLESDPGPQPTAQ